MPLLLIVAPFSYDRPLLITKLSLWQIWHLLVFLLIFPRPSRVRTRCLPPLQCQRLVCLLVLEHILVATESHAYTLVHRLDRVLQRLINVLSSPDTDVRGCLG